MEVLLAETRKYRLHTILAHQHLGQLEQMKGLKETVLANTGMKIIGSNSPETL